MFDTIFDLPLHPLVVHATVIVVPTAALAVLLAAVWPRFRRWAGLLPLGLALMALVLVPLSTESGEALEERVGGGSPLVETHAELGEGLLPWVIGLVVVAGVMLWRSYADRPPRQAPKWIAITLAVAALMASTGTVVQVVRIGHSGATASWSQYMDAPAPAGDSD